MISTDSREGTGEVRRPYSPGQGDTVSSPTNSGQHTAGGSLGLSDEARILETFREKQTKHVTTNEQLQLASETLITGGGEVRTKSVKL